MLPYLDHNNNKMKPTEQHFNDLPKTLGIGYPCWTKRSKVIIEAGVARYIWKVVPIDKTGNEKENLAM